jgi:hypothetical protein
MSRNNRVSLPAFLARTKPFQIDRRGPASDTGAGDSLAFVEESEDFVFYELVLERAGEDFLPAVLVDENALDAQRIVGWVDGEQDVDIRRQARAGPPRIPLVSGRDEGGGKPLGDGAGAVIDDELGGQGRPVVDAEDAGADETAEPWPVELSSTPAWRPECAHYAGTACLPWNFVVRKLLSQYTHHLWIA